MNRFMDGGLDGIGYNYVRRVVCGVKAASVGFVGLVDEFFFLHFYAQQCFRVVFCLW